MSAPGARPPRGAAAGLEPRVRSAAALRESALTGAALEGRAGPGMLSSPRLSRGEAPLARLAIVSRGVGTLGSAVRGSLSLARLCPAVCRCSARAGPQAGAEENSCCCVFVLSVIDNRTLLR